jgi:hypothetical protein
MIHGKKEEKFCRLFIYRFENGPNDGDNPSSFLSKLRAQFEIYVESHFRN